MLLKTNLYQCIFKLQHLFQNFPRFKQRKRTKLWGDCHSVKVNHAIETKQERENYKTEDREENITY